MCGGEQTGIDDILAILEILKAIVCVAAVFPKHAAPFGLAPRKVRELRKEHHVARASECKGAFKAICRRAEDSHF